MLKIKPINHFILIDLGTNKIVFVEYKKKENNRDELIIKFFKLNINFFN